MIWLNVKKSGVIVLLSGLGLSLAVSFQNCSGFHSAPSTINAKYSIDSAGSSFDSIVKNVDPTSEASLQNAIQQLQQLLNSLQSIDPSILTPAMQIEVTQLISEIQQDIANLQVELQQLLGAGGGGNPPSLTYTWVEGNFGACSATCGGGTQTRSVTCEDQNGNAVLDSNCSGQKPATSQSCNTQACSSSVKCAMQPIPGHSCIYSACGEWSYYGDSHYQPTVQYGLSYDQCLTMCDSEGSGTSCAFYNYTNSISGMTSAHSICMACGPDKAGPLIGACSMPRAIPSGSFYGTCN
jgi:hypothetical protein